VQVTLPKKRKKIALEFSDREEFRKALDLLDEAEGRWALPGDKAIIIELGDLYLFEDAELKYEKVPVVPMSSVPPEERAALRRGARRSVLFRE